MAKYIIEIPDEAIDFMGGRDHVSMFAEPECKVGERKHYALRISKGDITPYTEPDREAIEDEVWDFVKRAFWDMTQEDIDQCYDGWFPDSYQEAKDKYEEWKQEKGEIHVGDEVVIAGTTSVVVRVPKGDEKRVHYISSSGTVYCNNGYADIVKTGRHFDEVEKLLERMKAE